MNPFILGALYLFQGLHLIAKPGIRRFVILPILVNIILFTIMFFVLGYWLHQLSDWLLLYLPSWLAWVGVMLWWLFMIGFLAIVIFTFMTIANLIAAPFNSYLSEKIAWYLTGKSTQEMSLMQNLKDVPRVLARQAAIILYYLPRALSLLILYFIPVIQAAASVISFLFHAWTLSLTYIDYPTDNHRVSFQEMRLWLTERRLAALGFGSAILLFSFIPIFNFVVMPAAVAGATKWWIDESNVKL